MREETLSVVVVVTVSVVIAVDVAVDVVVVASTTLPTNKIIGICFKFVC